ncbi:MAG: hypothetical protein WDL87_03130 [Candidatus Omnitrophota bacterium]|jgi:hypothetical protein
MLLFKPLMALKSPVQCVFAIQSKRKIFTASECLILVLLIAFYVNTHTVFEFPQPSVTIQGFLHEKPLASLPADPRLSIEMSAELWSYLRTGLHYLESSNINYLPSFEHPGKKAYGALGLSRIAAEDVRLHYPSLSGFTQEDVFSKQEVYEIFAQKYADLLLRQYLKIDYASMVAPEVFSVLQKAWFLGPGLFKKGVGVIASREKRAQEYMARMR